MLRFVALKQTNTNLSLLKNTQGNQIFHSLKKKKKSGKKKKRADSLASSIGAFLGFLFFFFIIHLIFFFPRSHSLLTLRNFNPVVHTQADGYQAGAEGGEKENRMGADGFVDYSQWGRPPRLQSSQHGSSIWSESPPRRWRCL